MVSWIKKKASFTERSGTSSVGEEEVQDKNCG